MPIKSAQADRTINAGYRFSEEERKAKGLVKDPNHPMDEMAYLMHEGGRSCTVTFDFSSDDPECVRGITIGLCDDFGTWVQQGFKDTKKSDEGYITFRLYIDLAKLIGEKYTMRVLTAGFGTLSDDWVAFEKKVRSHCEIDLALTAAREFLKVTSSREFALQLKSVASVVSSTIHETAKSCILQAS